ncbi:phosphatidylglycerol lysyltransferase domain-containing protein [Microcoleus sp. bin38.metabat.b11b12b14.051]|uniref:phosphatidylglycerol lysyltransferase domain-containing protein n=1 Tax=Microcoleus sp. bin38.metabat.b11b12b14.051 TaxID=2742709 RepID=UPI0025EA3ABF|nr:phosphatidylglycerol lysyltransferase domain-containing protein [Microcoleus sp. bin38.metabat.b11b12b14.051]
MLSQKTRIGLWTASFLTGLVGVINLLSAVTPSLPDRRNWLEPFFPFPVRAGGHFFAAVIGFMLLTLATNLLRRKRIAWLLTVGLLIASILTHLIKGLDVEESLLSGVLLFQLLVMRKTFTAKSDRPSIAQGIRVLLGALLFTIAYGTAGFYILDRRFEVNERAINFDWDDAIFQTFAMFFTADNAGLVPKTRFASFFANSIYAVGAVTIGYALVMLLRPVLQRDSGSIVERNKAQQVVAEHGRTTLARLALLEDKSYYFSPSGKSTIAYVPKGRGAIALGDPIGPPEDRKEAILGFQEFCDRNDWYPAFYQTLPDDIEMYHNLGFRVVQIGEEAIVDLKTFTLKGKANQNLRTAINRLTKAGHQVEFYEPPLALEVMRQMKLASDEWLQMVQGAEKQFSVGWFDEAYLQKTRAIVIYTPNGKISAFANMISAGDRVIGVDLMRRRTEVENGTMECLFASMLQNCQELGYAEFDLGLSALAGVGEPGKSGRLEKFLIYLSDHLSKFYNFKGLHSFKDKFGPRWEPRYFVYPSWGSLPDVVVALIRADSGDRLLDYLRPGS